MFGWSSGTGCLSCGLPSGSSRSSSSCGSTCPGVRSVARGPRHGSRSSISDGADVLTTVTGTVPGAAVADLLVVGDRGATYDITYGITRSGRELRTVVLRGPFYEGATSTYTLRLKRLDQPVEITRP